MTSTSANGSAMRDALCDGGRGQGAVSHGIQQTDGKPDGLIEDCRFAKSVLCDTKDIDIELAERQNEIEVVTELSRKAIYDNARTAQNQSDFNERNNAYLERHRKATERIEELDTAKRERLAKGKMLDRFIADIQSRPLIITEFDESLWLAVIDRVTVATDGTMIFIFKSGAKITA